MLVSEGLVNGGNNKTLIGNTYAVLGEDPLRGLQGAIDDLDEICAVYKNENAAKARSIRAEDINRLTGYDPQNTYLSNSDITQRGNYGRGKISEYGNTVTYKIGSSDAVVGYKYGDMTEYSTTDVSSDKTSYIPWGESSSLGVGVESQPVKSNCYNYFINTLGTSKTCTYEEPGLRSTSADGYENSNAAYNMINNNNSSYWLASPYLNFSTGPADWGLRYVYKGSNLRCLGLWFSFIGQNGASIGVRAVVFLKPDVIPELKTST